MKGIGSTGKESRPFSKLKSAKPAAKTLTFSIVFLSSNGSRTALSSLKARALPSYGVVSGSRSALGARMVSTPVIKPPTILDFETSVLKKEKYLSAVMMRSNLIDDGDGGVDDAVVNDRVEGDASHISTAGLRFTRRKNCSNSITPRKPEAAWSVVDGCCCCNNVDQLCFIRWSHYNHVWQASHVCNIKCSTVGWSIRSN